MSKIKYRISLDMHSSVSQASLAAKQGDDNRQFCITFRSGRKPYKIERGAFAVFSTTLPDGKVIEDNCIIVNDEITYDFTQNLTSQVGVLDIEIRLYGPDSKIITSPTFILVVSPRAAGGESITSSNSYTALDTLYKDTLALKKDIEGKFGNLVSNALKGKASGAEIIIPDISPLAHTLNVKARSKNIMPYPYYNKTQTLNGLNFAVNEDGTITVSGTSTAQTTFYLQGSVNQGVHLESGVTYRLSGCPLGGGYDTYMLQGTNDKTYHADYGSGVNIVGVGEKFAFYIVIRANVTVTNLVFKPQLEIGTVTEYTPYVGVSNAKVIANDTTYPINADGTVDGVRSIYPTTTLIPDTEGVVLDVEYNRDINILTKTVPLIDRATGIPYYLYVSDGKLLIEESEV